MKMQNKLFMFPYFREEGGGQEGYQNVLIFYVLIRGRREGVKVNKDNCELLLMASLSFIYSHFIGT